MCRVSFLRCQPQRPQLGAVNDIRTSMRDASCVQMLSVSFFLQSELLGRVRRIVWEGKGHLHEVLLSFCRFTVMLCHALICSSIFTVTVIRILQSGFVFAHPRI